MSEKKDLTSKSLNGLVWMLSSGGVVSFLRVLMIAVLARGFLSKADFGVFQKVLIVVTFVDVFTQIGVGPAIIQKKDLEERHIHSAFIFSFLLGVITGGLVYILRFQIADFLNEPALIEILVYVTILFPIKGLSMISLSLLMKHTKFNVVAKIEAITFSIFYALPAIGFGVYLKSYWAMIIGLLAQHIVKSIVFMVKQPVSFKLKFDYGAIKELFYFTGGLTLTKIFNYFGVQGDRIIVARMLDSNMVGVYGRAYTMMTTSVTLFGQQLDKVLFSAMSKKQDDFEVLKKAYLRVISIVSTLLFPVTIILIILASDLVNLLLGSGWGEAVLPFQVLCLGVFFRVAYKVCDVLGKATGRVYSFALGQFVYAIVILTGSYFGAKQYGMVGAGVAASFAFMANFIFLNGLVMNILKNISFLEIMKSVFQGWFLMFVYGTVIFAAKWVALSVDLHFMLTLLLAGIVFVIASLLMILNAPRFFYGVNGVWIISKLLEMFPKKTPLIPLILKKLNQSVSDPL